MNGDRDYIHILEHLYEKSLILHDISLWHPVLSFYFLDALAHIDYTVGLLAFNYQSPKSMIMGEYMRWRIDEEKKGERAKFPKFVNWMKKEHPERFAALPSLWQRIYDEEDKASYRSFRIVLDPDSRNPIQPHVFYQMIEEFFRPEFLKSLYSDASLAGYLTEFSP